MVESVVAFFEDPEQRALMQKLVALGVGRPQPREAVAAEGPLAGMTFCVTGVLSRKREDVHADIRAAGGEVHDCVKKTRRTSSPATRPASPSSNQAEEYGAR